MIGSNLQKRQKTTSENNFNRYLDRQRHEAPEKCESRRRLESFVKMNALFCLFVHSKVTYTGILSNSIKLDQCRSRKRFSRFSFNECDVSRIIFHGYQCTMSNDPILPYRTY